MDTVVISKVYFVKSKKRARVKEGQIGRGGGRKRKKDNKMGLTERQ